MKDRDELGDSDEPDFALVIVVLILICIVGGGLICYVAHMQP